jgi:fumarate hydratase class II
MEYREENDTMGRVQIPLEAYYGAQTKRARDNFPVSGWTMPEPFLCALAIIKRCAARINRNTDLLEPGIADAIFQAAGEIISGRFTDQFIVDVFQTGSGTSTNMNMNEVIASRANEILTGKKGGKTPVHPNDHVNMCQSSNDVIPSAMHISAAMELQNRLFPSLETLQDSLKKKAGEFSSVKKIGRTHLQDAVAMTLGQEFSGYARQIELSMDRIQTAGKGLSELALGGTAVGTGLNAHPDFASNTIRLISEYVGIDFCEANNHFEAQGARDAVVQTSGALKTLAVSLMKIANDIRWLSSGPRCGIGEISLPPTQPGSSIMPGKVNPVIPEAVTQVAAQVMGNDTAITIAGQSGNFELNVMMPLMAYNLLNSISLLSNGSRLFAERCVEGIEANRKVCSSNIEKSLSLATNLAPEIGYDKAAEVAKKAYESGKTIREVVLEENLLEKSVLEEYLDT